MCADFLQFTKRKKRKNQRKERKANQELTTFKRCKATSKQ